MNEFNLNRFVEAQENTYPLALTEVKNGHKRSHWMWYIFPQLKHLGYSYNSRFYGLDGVDEAKKYLNHPILGFRLREIVEATLQLQEVNPIQVFGNIDALKLRSSMTLFDVVSPGDVFAQVLNKFFSSERDNKTLKLIG